MRMWIIAIGTIITAAAVVSMVGEAWARCPPGTAYRCYQGFNGKVICSCS